MITRTDDLTLALAAHAAAADDHHRATAKTTGRLDRERARYALSRSVLVVEDHPGSLLALVAAVGATGAPVHAVTTSPEAASALTFDGHAVTLVRRFAEAAAVWRAHRCGVVVLDVLLDGSTTGVELAHAIGRGPRVVLVSSRIDPDALLRDAREAQADAVHRDGTDSWERAIGVTVLRRLDEVAPSDRARTPRPWQVSDEGTASGRRGNGGAGGAL